MDAKCEDTGCETHYGGLGQCVNMTGTPWTNVKINYDLTAVQPTNNADLCRSSGADKDCCRCLKRYSPCEDNGCVTAGGICVDMLTADLGDQNVFPRSQVDLDTRIDGPGGTNLCLGSSTVTPTVAKCCECYKRKTT